jgi:hypothetical protein
MPIISSRIPEGEANLCPICGAFVSTEPSTPPGGTRRVLHAVAYSAN